jgi:RNA polymerase sigma factor (sigma-70 family)
LIVADSPTPAASKRSVGPWILKQEKISKAATSELVAMARGGDAKARKKLVAIYSYLPPLFTARLGASAGQSPEAMKVGVEALHAAIDRYPPDDPMHFTVYVRRWIERRIHAHLNRKTKPVKVRSKGLSQYQQRVAAQSEVIRALGVQLKKRLTDQQYEVARYRFGIGGQPRKTLTEIGEIMGLSRARVHQIERQAVKKLSTVTLN